DGGRARVRLGSVQAEEYEPAHTEGGRGQSNQGGAHRPISPPMRSYCGCIMLQHGMNRPQSAKRWCLTLAQGLLFVVIGSPFARASMAGVGAPIIVSTAVIRKSTRVHAAQ